MSTDGIPTSAGIVSRLDQADLPMPENSIRPVVEARSNKVGPVVVVRIHLYIDANDEPNSGCSRERSTQEIGGEATVGGGRHVSGAHQV